MWVMLCEPSTALGVPTHTMTSSQSATSAPSAVLAVSSPRVPGLATNSGTPGSVIGDFGEDRVDLRRVGSILITSVALAGQARGSGHPDISKAQDGDSVSFSAGFFVHEPVPAGPE